MDITTARDNEVYNRMLRAGWQPSRQTATSLVGFRLRIKGYTWFPAVERFLTEFGGLTIESTSGIDSGPPLFLRHLDIISGIRPIHCVPLRCFFWGNGDAKFLGTYLNQSATLVGHLRSTPSVKARSKYRPCGPLLEGRLYVCADGSLVFIPDDWCTLILASSLHLLLKWLIFGEWSCAQERILDNEAINSELCRHHII